MKLIRWLPQTIRDIESIRAFIAQDSPAYAELTVGRLVVAVERLQEFPESGRIVPERRNPSMREIILTPYRIVSRLRESFVEIATVFRGTRPITGSF